MQASEPSIEQQTAELKNAVSEAIQQARKLGASACEVSISKQTGISVSTRLQEVETLEYNRDSGMGISVYFGHRKGNASTADLRPQAIAQAVSAACDIARYTSEDPCHGLADAALMADADNLPDLDLYHPSDMSPDTAIDIAKRAEKAAFEADERIKNADGANYSSHNGIRVYGNSHGLLAGYPMSRHSLSCIVIAGEQQAMERDYSYSVSRDAERLWSPERVGQQAAERAVSRLKARKLGTRRAPVMIAADLASGLFGHLVGAISGSQIYRNSSFLKGFLNEQIFPEYISIAERPHIAGAMASAPFDAEGVASQDRMIIEQGVLQTYLLTSYSARKLNMTNTGHAGGIYNWLVRHSNKDFDALLKEMGTGLLVTELMGQGVNTVTGDYSRGAAGFWVENGELAYPVSEITIAGNLKDMFRNIVAVGNDIDRRSQILTGSILLEDMQIAGQ